MLLSLLAEYESMEKSGNLDIPMPMLPSMRGLVYEELSECGGDKASFFAKLAYEDLSQDEWFSKIEPARLARLKEQSEA